MTPASERDVLDLLNGFVRAQVLVSAHALGVFDAVADGADREPALAAALSLPPRSVTALVNACRALGLLERRGERFAVPAALVPVLTDRGDDASRGVHRYMLGHHYPDLYRSLTRLPDLLRGGAAADAARIHWLEYAKDRPNERDVDAYVPFMDATVPMIADAIADTYSFADRRVLVDLFGSTGVASRRFVERNAGLVAWFADLPAVVARASVPDPLASRLRPLPGDVFTVELPPEVDAVTIIRTAHDHATEAMHGLLQRIHDALVPGGVCVIAERMIPDTFDRDDVDLYLRAVTFLAMSRELSYRSAGDYESMFRLAGFATVEVREPARAPYVYYRGMKIVVATKR